MKIISLNINGYYNKNQEDTYDFDKNFEYLKVEANRNKEVVFCLQEFRVRKRFNKNNKEIEELYNKQIENLFEYGFRIVLNNKVYEKKDKEKFLEIINKNTTLYTINIILIKYEGRVDSGGVKYGNYLSESSEKIKYRFSYCRIWKDHPSFWYFYIFNIHIIASEGDMYKDIKIEYINILNKIIDTFNKYPDCNLIIGDYNFAKNEDRQVETIENEEYQKEKKELFKKLEKCKFKDLWKEQHKDVKDYTYFYDNDINNGRRLDYIYASQAFIEGCEGFARNKFKMYISHETNILWDKYIGFTDHSALVLVF